MSIPIEQYTLPTFWAPYLINGDSSGIEEKYVKWIDETITHLARSGSIQQLKNSNRRLHCVDVGEDSWFTHGAHDIPDSQLGCEVSTYTFHVLNG